MKLVMRGAFKEERSLQPKRLPQGRNSQILSILNRRIENYSVMELHNHDIFSRRDPLPHDGDRLETLIQIYELLFVLGVLSQTTIMRQ